MPNIKATKALQKRSDQALSAFHKHYALIWGEERWHNSLFPALCMPTRYCALMNQYGDYSESTAYLCPLDPENKDGGISELDLVPNVGTEEEPTKKMIRALIKTSTDTFPPPKPVPSAEPETRLLGHWNMDAASALAACTLGVRPGDRVLDLCAAPGGKSVVLAQMMWPHLQVNGLISRGLDGAQRQSILHSNEFDKMRHSRLDSNLKSYLPRELFNNDLVRTIRIDGAEKTAVANLPLGEGSYDKVLLDAPCSSERHIIHAHLKAASGGQVAEEMANWKSSHSKTLARTQVALLMTAMRAVKVDGTVLYATCSIAHEENDEVIEKFFDAVKRERKKSPNASLEWKVKVETDDEKNAQTRALLDSMTERTKYGRVALPDHPSNGRWGPLYFCRLKKVAPKGGLVLQKCPNPP